MPWLKVLEVALAVLAVIALHNAVLKTARANGRPVQRVSDAGPPVRRIRVSGTARWLIPQALTGS